MDDSPTLSKRWRQWRQEIDLDEYEARWDRLEAEGEHVHGEADFVDRFAKRRVLDAGCGMGRVALELAKREYDVVGVDNDPDMLERAKNRESTVDWRLGDLTTVTFDEPFDTIVVGRKRSRFRRAESASSGDPQPRPIARGWRPSDLRVIVHPSV